MPQSTEKRMQDTKIEIRQAWCKGCGFCVAACTRDVLQMDTLEPIPIVVEPERCTGCELCVWICPDFAINVTKDGDVPCREAEA